MLEAAANEAKQQIRELVAERTAPSGDTSEALLAESRLTRAWRRAERLLEGGEDPVILAQRAAGDKDRAVLAALKAELPDFLRAKGRGAEVQGTLAHIEAVEGPALSRVERAGREIDEELEGASVRTETAINYARHFGVDAEEIPGPDGLILLDGEAA